VQNISLWLNSVLLKIFLFGDYKNSNKKLHSLLETIDIIFFQKYFSTKIFSLTLHLKIL